VISTWRWSKWPATLGQAFRAKDQGAVERTLETHIHNVKNRILELLEARGGELS